MKFLGIFVILMSFLLISCSQQISTEEYIKNGETYFQNKQWKSAIIELKNAVKLSPKNAHVRTLLGKSYLKTYSSNAAAKEFKKALELGSADEEVIVLLGKAYEQLNQNENILSEINTSKDQSPTIQANIYAIRAKAYLRTNQLELARQSLEKARSLDENLTDVRLAWALYENELSNDDEVQRKWLEPLLEREGGNADAWSLLASIEQASKNYDKAEEAFNRAISLRKVVHFDIVRRALLYISQKKYDKAQEDLDLLKKAGMSWPVISYAEGLLAFQQSEYDKAQPFFEKALSESPDYSPAQLLNGIVNYHKGNYQSAVTNLELYLSSYPKAFQANYIYAASLVKLGKFKEARPILETLNKNNSDNKKVLSLLGSVYLQNNENKRAISMLRRVVDLDPSNAQARLQLAVALLREKSSLTEAQGELRKAIQLDPGLIQADIALFSSYIRNNQLEKAQETARELKLKQQGKSSLGSNLLAMSYFADSKIDQAVSELKDTLKLFPSDPMTSDNLAKVYFQRDELETAEKLYLDVIKKFPKNLKSYNQLALIGLKRKDQASVIKWLKMAVEKNPEILSARLLLANQYIVNNESSKALQILQAVSDEEKTMPDVILLSAKAKMNSGENQHAIRLLKSLLVKKPELVSANLLLAEAYAKENNPSKMRESLNEVVKLKPDNLAALLMLAKLDLYEKKFEDFKKRVSILFENYPKNIDVQFLNAKIVSSEKEFEGAINTLSEIMSQTPNSAVAVDLAKNQWANGDKVGAISGLEIWVQANASDKNALLVLAQFYLSENRNSEARGLFKTLDQLLPDNPVVLNNLAWLMKDSDTRQGIIYAEKALRMAPDNPFIMDTLAILHLQNGEAHEALPLARKASKLRPNLLDIQLNFSRILVANNKKTEATELLNKLLKNEKNINNRKVIRDELDKL